MDGLATVLICDDEPPLRELMRIALEPGYVCVEAADGAEALELADRLCPNLVLLDLMLPGLSGYDVIALLRANVELAHIPIVVVSAFTSEADRRGAYNAGAAAFVAKPFDPAALRTLVGEFVSERE